MYRIGIDIGGTQLRAALLDDDMNIIDSFKTINDRSLSGAANMDRIIRYIKSVDEPLQGIGIGSPGPLDLKRGVVVNPPNLIGWDNFEIVRYMEQKTGLKTWLDNDANVAGLAEALRGAGVGYESVAFIGISTGLGGAYVYKGELIHGAHSCGAAPACLRGAFPSPGCIIPVRGLSPSPGKAIPTTTVFLPSEITDPLSTSTFFTLSFEKMIPVIVVKGTKTSSYFSLFL